MMTERGQFVNGGKLPAVVNVLFSSEVARMPIVLCADSNSQQKHTACNKRKKGKS
jgi:hypothetical protein